MVELSWSYEGVDVTYTQELDGDGTSMARLFVEYLRIRYADRLPFECALEWCAGPGFIGFALLAAGICRRLVLTDINPRAVAAARNSVDRNGLRDQVRVFEGDNLDAVPAEERFDLVVSNPPNFYCLNPLHPSFLALKDDLRPNDPGWQLHRRFYREIPKFLRGSALLCIEEVDPFAEKCFMPNAGANVPLWGPEPFDIRPRPPIDDFIEMIEAAGLNYRATECLPHPSVPVHLVISCHEPGAACIRLRDGVMLFERLGDPIADSYRICALRDGREIGSIELTDSTIWIIGLLERLVARREQAQSAHALMAELGVGAVQLRDVLDGLRGLRWIHAPAGCV